ncbi:hypothetical protein [Plantactinospora sp. DSM 117369]
MDHAWQGGASEQAYTVFDGLAQAFRQMKGQFYKLAQAYEDFSRFVWTIGAVLADTIKMIADTVIEYLTRKRGGPIAEAYVVVYQLKIVRNVAHLGYIMLTARGMVAGFYGNLALFEINTLPPAVKGSVKVRMSPLVVEFSDAAVQSGVRRTGAGRAARRPLPGGLPTGSEPAGRLPARTAIRDRLRRAHVTGHHPGALVLERPRTPSLGHRSVLPSTLTRVPPCCNRLA